jgi:plasmid stabilization system protein ParE
MAIGSKQKYTDAQKRKAEHIEDSYEAKGVSHEKAEQIAWATVNKQAGGGERSGSGTTTPETAKEAARKDSAVHAAETRQAKAEPNALEDQSIAALRSKARKKHISGRSTMSKVELILALRQKR